MTRSKLWVKAQEAVEVAHELQECLRNRKLTAKAFLDLAVKNADTSIQRLNLLEQATKEPDTDAIAAFLRKAAKYVAEPTCPHPPPAEKFAKMCRVLGSDALPAELARLGYSVGEALALAVRNAGNRYPDRFGKVTNLEEHDARTEALRQKHKDLLVQMQETITGSDISYGEDGAPFVAGTLVCFAKGWPEKLLDHVASDIERKVA